MIRHREIATQTVLPVATSFVIGNTQFPDNWLLHALPEDLERHGIETVELSDPEPIITADMVDLERERRTAGGIVFEGVSYQTRSVDRENIAGAVTLAALALSAGVQPGDLHWHGGAEPFVWISTDNSLNPMDALTMVNFGKAVAAHKSAHIFAGRTLKSQGAIPVDYAEDLHWPDAQV